MRVQLAVQRTIRVHVTSNVRSCTFDERTKINNDNVDCTIMYVNLYSMKGNLVIKQVINKKKKIKIKSLLCNCKYFIIRGVAATTS